MALAVFDPRYDYHPLARAYPSPFLSPHRQVFFACGLVLLVFELVFVPIITPLWGIRFCQRLGSVVEIPIYFVIPLLTHMSTTGVPVRMAAIALLFTFLACTDPVGAWF